MADLLAFFVYGCFLSLELLDFALIFNLEILAYDHKVESDFFLTVFLNPLLDFLLGQGKPVLFFFEFANQDRSWLQAIKFVEMALMRDVAYEVIDVGLLPLLFLIFFEDEGLGTTETIMKASNGFRVAQRQATILGVQKLGELMEFFDVSLNLDGGIEQNRQYGLCGAGVVHNLSGKE